MEDLDLEFQSSGPIRCQTFQRIPSTKLIYIKIYTKRHYFLFEFDPPFAPVSPWFGINVTS